MDFSTITPRNRRQLQNFPATKIFIPQNFHFKPIPFSPANDPSNQTPHQTRNKPIIIQFLTFWITFIHNYLKSSSIHGFSHLARPNRHGFEKCFWLVFIILAGLAACFLSLHTLHRYETNPIVITLGRDRFSWQTKFPAVTICPLNKYDPIKLTDYVRRSAIDDKKRLRDFIERLLMGTYETFADVPTFNDVDPAEYLKIVLDVQFKFNPLVYDLNNELQPDLLKQVLTEMGLCYSYQSSLAYYSHPEYVMMKRFDVVPRNLSFTVHPFQGEVLANIKDMKTGYVVYFHEPNDIVDIASRAYLVPDGYLTKAELTALSILTGQSAIDLSIDQRRCRFVNESNLKRSPVYSYRLCRVECRIRLCKKLCGCVPYFYRLLHGEKLCDVAGLHCLSKHSEHLITLTKNNKKEKCKCLTNCNEVNYVVKVFDLSTWFTGVNLQWGLKQYPKLQLHRQVIFSLTDLLVYIGNMAGLFLGCCALGFIELVYFFTLRLFWYILDHRSPPRRRKSIGKY